MSKSDSRLTTCLVLLIALLISMPVISNEESRRVRARDVGIEVGTMETGKWNAITDVFGVKVGHKTIILGDSVHTGATAILPHEGNIFLEKVPAAIAVGNGFGKLAGYTQVEELGNIETPIVLTNTLSVCTAIRAVIEHTLVQPGNENVRSVNAVVGETNDGYLNDIRGMHVKEKDVLDAITSAKGGPVEEGSVGAASGTIAFGFKGGIGTASRLVQGDGTAKYTLGVLVQSNYGGSLDINGAPVGRELERKKHKGRKDIPGSAPERVPKGSKQGKSGLEEGDGSCMIVLATDAPLSPRNLKRLARRALLGLARTGSHMSNGSGDYVISFSTAYRVRYGKGQQLPVPPLVPNTAMTPLFQATVEATQEAVYNSMLMATTVEGQKGRVINAIPIDEVVKICKKYNVLDLNKRLIPSQPE